MHYSIKTAICLMMVFNCLFHIPLYSQTISYQTPDDFYVCGSAAFDITVTNTSNTPMQGVSVLVDFTTNDGTDCGVAYMPGTVVSASEFDLSNLGAPVFELADIPAGDALTFTMQVEAPCSVVDCIDDAAFFVNEIMLNWNGGSTSTTTNPYVIERALLVVTAVNNSFMAGSQGDVLFREITIVNSRPGALQGFLFTDVHQGGISISAGQGTDLSPAGSNIFQIALDGSDFADVGDGDELFELNESIVIREFIRINDCGVDITSTVSEITAGWGCGGAICQDVSAVAIIDILPSQKEPILIWEPMTSYGECFCGPEAYRQGMKITNVGIGSANDLVFDMRQVLFNQGVNFALVDKESVAVDSAGVLLDLQASFGAFTDSLSAPCNGTDNELSNQFILTIPELGPSQSLTIFWDIYFCEMSCGQPRVDWEYKWSYFKPCPPAPYVEVQDYILVSDSSTVNMTASLSVDSNIVMMDQDVQTLLYELNYDSLTLLNDELVVSFVFPCGFNSMIGDDFELGGQLPTQVAVSADSLFNYIDLTYQLPLNSNDVSNTFDLFFSCEDLCTDQALCRDSLVSSCEVLPCASSQRNLTNISVTSTVLKCEGYPVSCNLQACSGFSILYECPIDSVCFNRPPGYATFDFEAKRKNIGLPDNDSDRLPDASGAIDLSAIRTDRLIVGDTILAELAGEVVIDSAGVTLPFGSINIEFFETGFQAFNSNAILENGSGIMEVGTVVRIFDQSTSTYFTCNSPSLTVFDTPGLIYQYDISALGLGGCLPLDFEFDQGDSILFEGQYRLMHNIVEELPPSPLSGFLTVRPVVRLFNEFTDFYEPISCSCTASNLEVTGYKYELLPGIYGVPPCSPSTYAGGSLFRFEIAQDEFFPFEYRSFLNLADWQIGLSDEVSLLEAKLTFLRYQGGDVIASGETLDWTVDNGQYTLDIDSFQMPFLDEGWLTLVQYLFEMDCDLTGSLPLDINLELDFDDGLNAPEDPLEWPLLTNAIQAMIPNLNILAFNFDLISFDNQMTFDFFLANMPTTVSSQSSAAAPNTWLYVVSETGLVTDLEITDPATGMPIPSVNGVYQLGDFPVDTLALQIRGLNNSCETEKLTIHYGWNCDPFENQVQTSCYRRSTDFTITSPPGEIDFLVESPSGCYDLCETLPPYSLEIANGQLGAVYGLTANAQMPPGQTVVAGSSQVEYPSGSGNFYPIDDPLMINSTLFEWDLSLFDSLVQGLPGINAAPDNAITLFFETSTECGFVADAFSLFTIASELNCGIPSNTVGKPGDPVCINGVNSSYTTNIDVTTPTTFTCGDEMVFEFSMTASEDLPAGACVIVTLPQGVSLVPNSCSSACQNNFNCTPFIEGDTYTWVLPAGVSSNQIICFEFNTVGWSSLPCGDGLVIFRTANETQALCAESGQLCTTKINTGSLLFPYEIERPIYELDNFMMTATQSPGVDLIDFSIDVTNCGPQNEPPLVIDIFIDEDGDGTGDQLIHSESVVTLISDCETANITGSFSLPPNNLCNLIAYINADQCACSIDSVAVFSPIDYQTDQSIVACSGEPVPIGVGSQPGFSYQWQPADCLDNENEAMAVFNCLNNTPVPVNYAFVLAESDGLSCTINNLIEVTLQPVPGIAFAESPVCAGQPANIAATDGILYQWQGPDIVDPGIQVQTVAPLETSTYSVTVTDVFGCEGEDMVVIEVAELPEADAGEDQFFCPGTTAQLNAVVNSDWEYLWSPAILNGVPVLSDPSIPDPLVLVTDDLVFTLTVTDENGCTATDEVFVSQSGALNLMVSPDIIICEGASTTLSIEGGDFYDWTPMGDCNDPACSSITVSPLVPTTYTAVATTFDGCIDSVSVTVTTTNDDFFTFDTLRICEGDMVVIHGMAVNEAGIYIDTIGLGLECDSVSTVTLFVDEAPPALFIDAFLCEGDSIEFNDVFLSDPGTYSDTLLSSSGCDSIVQLSIVILNNLVAIQGPHSGAPGDSIVLSIDPSNFSSIVWTGGGMGDDCNDVPECADVIGEQDVIYTVMVEDVNGCVAIDTHIVFSIIQCFPEKAEVPNVFTPNNDGVNDVFSIVTPDSEEVLSMRVWDRWGNLVYKGKGPWNGTYKDEPAMQDVYIYDIVVGCPAGIEADDKLLRGDVTLLR